MGMVTGRVRKVNAPRGSTGAPGSPPGGRSGRCASCRCESYRESGREEEEVGPAGVGAECGGSEGTSGVGCDRLSLASSLLFSSLSSPHLPPDDPTDLSSQKDGRMAMREKREDRRVKRAEGSAGSSGTSGSPGSTSGVSTNVGAECGELAGAGMGCGEPAGSACAECGGSAGAGTGCGGSASRIAQPAPRQEVDRSSKVSAGKSREKSPPRWRSLQSRGVSFRGGSSRDPVRPATTSSSHNTKRPQTMPAKPPRKLEVGGFTHFFSSTRPSEEPEAISIGKSSEELS